MPLSPPSIRHASILFGTRARIALCQRRQTLPARFTIPLHTSFSTHHKIDQGRVTADFRSDTLTQPTDEMFRVMQQASRGDDVYAEDSSVRALEAHVAQLTGHEAGLFCASGTMTNQLAFRASLLIPPASILCDSRSHVYRYEAGGLAAHSQLTVYPVKPMLNNGHHLTVQDLERELIVDDGDVHMAPTRLISLENTLDGTVMPLQEVQAIGRFAKEKGVLLHLDGARIWNATVAQGCELRDYTREFDSASLCVSKGIGAPIGSVLVGNQGFIQKARHFRKMFGGGWRQAGGIAAAAHWCIDNVWPTMKATHALAQQLAEGLERDAPGSQIYIPVETNMVFLDLAGSGILLRDLSRRLYSEKGIEIGNRNAPDNLTQVRLVLHWQITTSAVEDFLSVVKQMASTTQASAERTTATPFRKERDIMTIEQDAFPDGDTSIAKHSGSVGDFDVASLKNPDYMRKFDRVIDDLQDVYSYKIRPLEKAYNYEHFSSSAPLGNDDIAAKPMVLLIGQYSTGKTTFINSLLKKSYPSSHIGVEPTTDRFVAVMDNPTERIIPGNAAAVSSSLPFKGLDRFGQAFLSRFQVSQTPSPVLQNFTIVDTPGILSGDKQRDRGYDYTSVIEWFAERADLVLLLFDSHKLDISNELKAAIHALKGHEEKVRVVLNKSDMVNQQQLMRVYGALMWSLGKVVHTPEVMRVYLVSIWLERPPNAFDDCRTLLESEKMDLLMDLQQLPINAAIRKVNEIVKRARLARVHALIVSHLREQMPSYYGKAAALKQLSANLEQEFKAVSKKYRLPMGDFPDVEKFREALVGMKFEQFSTLNTKLLDASDEALGTDLPELLQRLPHHSTFTGTTAKPELDSDEEESESEERPLRRSVTKARSRYAPVKPERDYAAIVYNIVLLTLVLFFTTVVGGGIALKMGWVEDLGPLIEFLKP
ncbi:EH domain-containing protein 1 [Haplosporangium sp. Z 11]|nr:EH domain-containing protein 1 [Haplosporangium sp. Z 11]